MLIDDNSDDRILFEDSVRSLDARIDLVSDDGGDAGLTRLRRERIVQDFVFPDISLPGMGGRSRIADVRSGRAFQNIGVTMCSASHDSREINELVVLHASRSVVRSKGSELLAGLNCFF